MTAEGRMRLSSPDQVYDSSHSGKLSDIAIDVT